MPAIWPWTIITSSPCDCKPKIKPAISASTSFQPSATVGVSKL